MKKFTDDKTFWDKQFKDRANMPIIWYMTAEELRFSYSVLADCANKMFEITFKPKTPEEAFQKTLPSSLMIAGYAMENYFKGMIVKRSPNGAFDKNGKFALKDHNLINLAASAGFQLNDDEKELFEILNHFILSGGRYPIPLKAEDIQPVYFRNGSIAPIGGQYYDNQKKCYCIFNKIDLIFERLITLCPIVSK